MLTGSSKEMETQAQKMTDAQLTEIAWMNDAPAALKARAELARRTEKTGKETLCWARVAGAAALIGIVIALAALVLQVRGGHDVDGSSALGKAAPPT